MARSVLARAPARALLFTLALGASRPALASYYGSVEDIWERYLRMVGARDEVEVLSCYHPNLRNQLSGDKTAAGRARLSVHMAEMYELLMRDFDYVVVEQKEEGDRAAYTLKFNHRKKRDEHTSTVSFLYEDGRWFVTETPGLPKFLSAGKGTITMIAGVAIAIIAIGLLVRKALG